MKFIKNYINLNSYINKTALFKQKLIQIKKKYFKNQHCHIFLGIQTTVTYKIFYNKQNI